MTSRTHAWATLVLAGSLAGCSCGDDDDDQGARLTELAQIGTEGGTFELEGLTGVVPAGAVEDGVTVVVSGEISADTQAPPGAIGPVYELEVDQQLREPITLEFPYDATTLGNRSPLALRVASSRDGLVWDCEPGTAPREQSTSVLATVSHMSFWVLRFNPCGAQGDCTAPEVCFDPGPDGVCATPCAGDADCPTDSFCFCGVCSRDSCDGAADDCLGSTSCSVEEGRGVCLPGCTPFDRCGDPEEQQLCSPGGRCAFQESALCPDGFACEGGDTCLHQWCVPSTAGCECGVDPGCDCEPPPAECAEVAHEDCENGEDDDDDDLIDCADDDCAAAPPCNAGLPEDCAVPGDEDDNGLSDCADPACAEEPACSGGGDEDCGNAQDDDGDTLVDCLDPDCSPDAACADGPWPIEVTAFGRRATRGPMPENVDWLAFQDGDGAWTELTGDTGVYTALVEDADGRYGIAWGCDDDRPRVNVQYAVATQAGEMRVSGCFAPFDAETVRVSGNTLGGDCVEINVNNQTLVGCQPAGWFVDIPLGSPADVFAVDIADGESVPTRGLLQRDVPVVGDTNVTIDFDGAEAFDLERHTRTDFALIAFRTANDSGLSFGFGSDVLEYGGVPLAAQHDGDGHQAFIPSAGGAEYYFFKAPVDVAPGVPPPDLPVVTGLPLGAEPYPLFAVDLDAMPAGSHAVEMTLINGGGAVWSLRATTAWLAGGLHLETPDFSRLPSWGVVYEPGAAPDGGFYLYGGVDADAVDCFTAQVQRGYARDGLRCPFRNAVVTF